MTTSNSYPFNPYLRQLLPLSADPTPEDYANALIQYGRSQPPIRTPGALASNLAAAAINHFVPSPSRPNTQAPAGDGAYASPPVPGALRVQLGLPNPLQLFNSSDGSDAQ